MPRVQRRIKRLKKSHKRPISHKYNVPELDLDLFKNIPIKGVKRMTVKIKETEQEPFLGLMRAREIVQKEMKRKNWTREQMSKSWQEILDERKQ